MTTRLKRPVRRLIELADGKRLIVALVASGIEFREFGRKTWLHLPYGRAHLQAAAIATGFSAAPQPRRRRSA